MRDTLANFDSVVDECKEIFKKKLKDYGSSWRVFRLESLTDQIFIKARRIRSIQEKKIQKIINETTQGDFMAILNYAVIGLIQTEKEPSLYPDMSYEEAIANYDEQIKKSRDLMEKKNHDYAEAWRDMSFFSITDMILQKISRLKHIEKNELTFSILNEKAREQYIDILNYSAFYLIKKKEQDS